MGELRAGLDLSIKAAQSLDMKLDAAAIATARAMADYLDAVRESGTGAKAMYLIPHYMGVLKSLQLTPEARAAAEKAAKGAPTVPAPAAKGASDDGSALGKLRSVKGGKSA